MIRGSTAASVSYTHLDVYKRQVQKKDDTIGLATVYRTLKMLEDMDLLNKVYMMGQQNVHPNDPNHEVHYHLILSLIHI